MLQIPQTKYRPAPVMDMADRQWPARTITSPPRWLSTDLRDGNQALIDPMSRAAKRRLFDHLVNIGFKEIEVAFPAASETDFQFVRDLIDQDAIPDDVTIQVLTQSRDDLIIRTFEALAGVPRATVHLYNAIAPAFRRVVFGGGVAEVTALAVAGARRILAESRRYPDTEWTFQYSPETFSSTEPDVALAVCAAVLDVWQPTPQAKVILNLPATVEVSTPNVYADRIEHFCRHVPMRDSVVISVHPHNDRGTGVAAAELAVLAGAERVEGCLFGNGERTGNVDLVTLALNLYSQGVAPGLDFSDIDSTVAIAAEVTGLPVHPRHPYAGELVFTAFSGSHQDAVRKGFADRDQRNDPVWEVPYLPVDPVDLGRSYEAVIRVNGQSGKAGASWILNRTHGLNLPRAIQVDFAHRLQIIADHTGRELTADDIWAAFADAYVTTTPPSLAAAAASAAVVTAAEAHTRPGVAGRGADIAAYVTVTDADGSQAFGVGFGTDRAAALAAAEAAALARLSA
ncbi:2-isopropylmalate synthase [Tistrella bauzanensis]|uniref:2-isopropylmalate synthase n=1 Tax=Tistrella bauzanensis TaxID=657419 RepID=A0ABQ1IJD0_9PROT|nr:2-isopropylmalate synthase [Tistrella bauzanensis]GGB44355.1 2-isopropylmalate synthase [Tistrella bauzanensis]